MKYTDTANLKDTMRNHGICVVIPTYNNAGTLRHVVEETLQYCDDVIVVNDGSTDDTRHILLSISGIDLVDYSKNQGKGTALKRGFRRAKERGFRYAITLDSDGQHFPEDIENFVKAIVEMPGTLIVGERDLTNVDINAKSSFANKFSNFWFWVQTGLRLNDTQTGYRAYPMDGLHAMALLTSRYEAELELLVFSSWHGTPIVSIPIQVFYPPQSQRVSHFRPAKDFARISVLNTILCVLALVYGLPLRIFNSVAKRKIFSGEFTPFTHTDGVRRQAAITLGRIGRSLFGAVYFLFWALIVFMPLTPLFFAIGKDTEAKKLRFHRMLQLLSAHFTRMFPGAKVRYENVHPHLFQTPAIVICNHQSQLDLPILMALHPKLIFLTNDRVWNNPYYGRVIHRAEFLPVSTGIGAIVPHLKQLRDRGYSIVIFPEGTRSADCSILKFHQGAFYLARELQMDILPMVLHGAGHYMPKLDTMFRKGEIVLRILPRIKYTERPDYFTTRAEARQYRQMMQQEYSLLASTQEKCAYFRTDVLYRYAYRGWNTVARCKAMLKRIDSYASIVDNCPQSCTCVRIIHSGIGVFPLLYALVNKDVQVYAFEENLSDYRIATETASLPGNLHCVHAVWASDYSPEGLHFDQTIIIDGQEPRIYK